MLASFVAGGAEVNPSSTVPLTNAQQVVQLGLDRARTERITVRLRGVLTFAVGRRAPWFFVQDESGAVLVTASNAPPFQIASGQLVEVEGVTAAGAWVPYVEQSQTRLLGNASLPAPRHTPVSQLAHGADFGIWTELEATVRDVAVSKGRLVLLCAQDGVNFQAWCDVVEHPPLPLGLLDARVRLQGVPWPEVGPGRQVSGFTFRQPSTNWLTVLQAGSANLFDRQPTPIRRLRERQWDRNARVQVAGVVTWHSPTGWLCIQDGTGGAWARELVALQRDDDPQGEFREPRTTRLQVGDRIELIGAPTGAQSFAPTLDDAEFRVVGKAVAPAPRVLTVPELLSGQHDAELVKVNARVVDVERREAGNHVEHKVWLQSGALTFEALWGEQEGGRLLVRPEDFVAVTGVCRVEPGQFQQVRSFALNLRSAADLTATRPPPGWSLRWLAWGIAGTTGGILVALLWILALRRQVTRRTAELSAANRQLQAEMQERRRFVSIIEATSDLVAMAGMDGRTLYLNRAGRRMLELPEGCDIQGIPMDRFYPPDVNRFFQDVALPQAIREGLWVGETRLLTRTGRELPISFVGLVVKSSDGTPEHLACVARDISDRQRIEVELRAALEAEKELSLLKSNFVSMVSHEFRTPLGTIQSSAELLQHYQERLSPERRTRLLTTIVASSGEMARMMEDVLLLSRVESARYEFRPCEIVLADFCRHLVDEVTSATRAQCPITLNLQDLPETARCDEGLLRHIFNNLLSNAVKYSPPGSTVELTVRREGAEAIFTVRDHGAGIAPEDQAKLFQPFVRGRNVSGTQGTGLGLVIVQRCVSLHGGTLHLTSTPNLGTTISVRLPLFVAPASDTALVRRWTSPSLSQSAGEA